MAGGRASSPTTILPPNGPSSHWTHRHTHTRSLSLSHTPSLPPPHLSPTHQSCAPPSSNSILHHKVSLLIIQSPSKHIQPNPPRSRLSDPPTQTSLHHIHPLHVHMNLPASLPSRPQQRIRRSQTRKAARLCLCAAHDVFMHSFVHSFIHGCFFFWGGGWKKKRIRRERERARAREREVWGGKAKGKKRKRPEPGAYIFVCYVATSLYLPHDSKLSPIRSWPMMHYICGAVTQVGSSDGDRYISYLPSSYIPQAWDGRQAAH
jgi:hypothetical protein